MKSEKNPGLRFLFLIIGVSLVSGIFLVFPFQRIFPPEPLFARDEKTFHQEERFERAGLKSGRPEAEIPKEAVGNLKLFILAGQSNMSGYGEIDPKDDETEPRAFVFGNNYRWKPGREPVDDPSGQVDPVSLDIGVGYSCGTSFAKTFIKYHPSGFVGLIPCAKNGSSIEEWQRNLSDNSLYGSCLKRALAASPMGKIQGLLFFQGETDALDPSLEVQKAKSPFQWGEKFSRFVSDFRKDLKIRDLPVVFAQIGTNKDQKAFKNWKIVQEEQGKVRLTNCRMIKTDDLSLKDEVHFDRKSYRVLGERFGLAITEIMSKRDRSP